MPRAGWWRIKPVITLVARSPKCRQTLYDSLTVRCSEKPKFDDNNNREMPSEPLNPKCPKVPLFSRSNS
jgi:hypothetical protein